jgi:hypothetical protein
MSEQISILLSNKLSLREKTKCIFILIHLIDSTTIFVNFNSLISHLKKNSFTKNVFRKNGKVCYSMNKKG